MFPSIEIAKTFKLSKAKCGYLINYELAPFLKDVLLKSINASEPYFVIWYDERQVCTSYVDSNFLNRLNATNLHTVLSASLVKLSEKHLLQMSMVGPNVNWSALGLFSEEQSKQEFSHIINFQSCGLHNVHGAFKSGMKASGWNFAKVLKQAWQLLRGSPAWGDTYILICKSQDFPLRYVCVWWNDLLSMVISCYFNFDFRLLCLFWNFINCLINRRCAKPSLYP